MNIHYLLTSPICFSETGNTYFLDKKGEYYKFNNPLMQIFPKSSGFPRSLSTDWFDCASKPESPVNISPEISPDISSFHGDSAQLHNKTALLSVIISFILFSVSTECITGWCMDRACVLRFNLPAFTCNYLDSHWITCF